MILVLSVIVLSAVAIIIATGRTPSRIAYEVELERAANAMYDRQTNALNHFKIGDFDRFDWSQEQHLIVFSHGGKPQVVAEIQFVGSYSTTSKTWLWAWANDSIASALSQDSLRVKAFGLNHRLRKLTEAKWPANEKDGWEMTTFQAYVVGAEAMYRTPFRQGQTYLTLKHLRWVQPGEHFIFIPAGN